MKKYLLLFLVAIFSFACANVEDQAKEKCEAIVNALDDGDFAKVEKLAGDWDEWYSGLNKKDQAKADKVVEKYADELVEIFGSYMEDVYDLLEDEEDYYDDEEDWW